MIDSLSSLDRAENFESKKLHHLSSITSLMRNFIGSFHPGPPGLKAVLKSDGDNMENFSKFSEFLSGSGFLRLDFFKLILHVIINAGNYSDFLGVRTMAVTSGRSLAKLERGDLAARVIEVLRGEIVTGKRLAGSRLPAEGKLAEEFGVSRNVIREAMRAMRAMGLIEMSQGRAPHVKASDPAMAVDAMESMLRDIDNRLVHLTEVRFTLESEIAMLACRRRTAEDLVRLEECVEALKREPRQDRQIGMDYEFHRRLAETTRNPVFVYIFAALSGLIRKSQQTTYPKDGLVNAIAGHGAILAAVAARDEVRAAAAMRQHLKHAEAALLEKEHSTNHKMKGKTPC